LCLTWFFQRELYYVIDPSYELSKRPSSALEDPFAADRAIAHKHKSSRGEDVLDVGFLERSICVVSEATYRKVDRNRWFVRKAYNPAPKGDETSIYGQFWLDIDFDELMRDAMRTRKWEPLLEDDDEEKSRSRKVKGKGKAKERARPSNGNDAKQRPTKRVKLDHVDDEPPSTESEDDTAEEGSVSWTYMIRAKVVTDIEL
jgi:hypothetical protein